MMRVKWLWVLFWLPLSVAADNITLPNQLSNETVADADDVQANFDALLNESNDNDQRIFQNQTSLQSIQISVRGFQYEWLGYTPEQFVSTGAQNTANGPNLSMFCKDQFSDSSASVADLEMLEQVMRSQSLPAPPSTAFALYTNDFVLPLQYGSTGVNAFWGVSILEDSQGGGALCTISYGTDCRNAINVNYSV